MVSQEEIKEAQEQRLDRQVGEIIDGRVTVYIEGLPAPVMLRRSNERIEKRIQMALAKRERVLRTERTPDGGPAYYTLVTIEPVIINEALEAGLDIFQHPAMIRAGSPRQKLLVMEELRRQILKKMWDSAIADPVEDADDQVEEIGRLVSDPALNASEILQRIRLLLGPVETAIFSRALSKLEEILTAEERSILADLQTVEEIRARLRQQTIEHFQAEEAANLRLCACVLKEDGTPYFSSPEEIEELPPGVALDLVRHLSALREGRSGDFFFGSAGAPGAGEPSGGPAIAAGASPSPDPQGNGTETR